MKFANVESEYKKLEKEVRREDVLTVLEWVNAQPHLPKVDELEALVLYYASNCSIELAKQRLDAYFTCITVGVDLFKWEYSETLVQQMEYVIHFPLKARTDEGHKLMYHKFLATDPANIVADEHFKLLAWAWCIWLLGEGTAPGHQLIVDMEGVGFKHLALINFKLIRHILTFVQEAMPMRPGGVHIINAMAVADKLMMLIKPILKKEYADLIHIHKDLDSLCQHIPKNVLPQHLGGEGPTLKEMHDGMKRNIQNSVEFCKTYSLKKQVDETKRPKESKRLEQFGMNGSFKTLDID